MSWQQNGLNIVIFPPDGEQIFPNQTERTRVTITNIKHQKGVKLEVFFDLTNELRKWCTNPTHKITIGYQQTQEIEFIWNIPPQAIPDTYYYNFGVRFLRSTSFYTFQPKRRQLNILRPKVEPKIKNLGAEPTFAITPASSSTQPIILSATEHLTLEIDVHNRSNRTDNFRISTDLDNPWYTIHYPEAIKKVGVIDGNNALNLNPGKEGKIYFNITPPADTVAGNYKPEITLYSLNNPDLFLKKILYLNIPPKYILQAEIQIILNKVSYKKGQYKIILTNQGNTFRLIDITAKSSDEDEFCEYYLEKYSVRISPNKTIEVKLEIQPNSKQKRPFISTKQFNFQVDLIDKNNHPLPKSLPLKSNLFWRSRPWWQTLLLLLLALGCIGGITWMIWKVLQPPPEPELSLKPERAQYYYGGDPIALAWTAKNIETINKIIIFDQEHSQDKINTKCYVFKPELEQESCYLINKFLTPNNETPDQFHGECTTKTNLISCYGVTFTHAQKVQSYSFKLQAFTNSDQPQEITTESVSILPRPTLQIFAETLNIVQGNKIYRPRDTVALNFEVSDINQDFAEADKIFLVINKNRESQPRIINDNIKDFCYRIHSDRYSCKIENISLPTDGQYEIGIEFQPDSDGRIDQKPERFILPKSIIVQTPIKLEYFRINDKSTSPIVLEPDTPIKISWSVKGKDVNVSISCIGETLRSSGIKYRQPLPPGESESCTITASDIHNKSIQPRTLRVKVNKPPEPEKPLELPNFPGLSQP